MSLPLPEDSFRPSLSHLVEQTAKMLRTQAKKSIKAKQSEEPSFPHLINLIAKMLRDTAGKQSLHPARVENPPENSP